jgi:serine/threonine protein kinase
MALRLGPMHKPFPTESSMNTNQQNSKNGNWLPETLGQYKIMESLGQGGMGAIYRAIQVPLDRVVALKVLPPNLSHSEEFSLRFEAEAKAISLLQHQNIVSLFDYGEEHGVKYFAMQYIEGEDLSKQIQAKKPIPVATIIDFSKQICRGLRYAHSMNVIHRDIKPQNILVDRNNVCHISDFGIAKIFQGASLTITGMAVGTPEYMSPEQAEGGELDAQTDIYSLGIVMYELLTKHPPFSGSNPVAIAYKQVHEFPVPPSAHRKDTPNRLELIVLKALKKNKKQRYRTVEELLEDLDSVIVDERVNRPTVPFAIHRQKSDDTTNTASDDDKRITDRRSGERRRSRAEVMRDLVSFSYWIETIQTQWLALFLIAILAILFVIHILQSS